MTLDRPDLPEAADAELLTLTRSGNYEAFRVLYDRHLAAAQRLANQLVAAPKLADNVVAEAFARVRDVIVRGGGPANAVRPYVLTAVRRVCYDRLRGREQQPEDAAALPDPGELLVDPAYASLQTALLARAYLSLPERSRAVLWHTEVEQDAPADVAPLLGLTRNGVSALRRRAADDLRQAYLQTHISLITQPACRPVAERLSAFDQRSLSARDAALVSEHLARCEGCQVVHRELADIAAALRGVIAPLVLGAAAEPYLAGAGHRAAALTAGPSGRAVTVAGTAAAIDGSGDDRAGNGSDAGLGILSPAGPATASQTARLPGPDWARHSLRAHQRSLRRAGRSRRLAAAAAAGVLLEATAAVTLAMALTGNDNSPASAGQLPVAPSRQASVTQAPQSPSQSPSPSASPSPSPSAAPPPVPVAAPIRLTASLSVSGRGASGHPEMVAFQVANTSSSASGQVTAVISLPAGTSLFSGSFGGGRSGDGQQGGGSLDGTALPISGGWSCTAAAGGATCTHAGLGAGQQAQGILVITVSSGACGQSVRLTVTSGATTETASQAIRC